MQLFVHTYAMFLVELVIYKCWETECMFTVEYVIAIRGSNSDWCSLSIQIVVSLIITVNNVIHFLSRVLCIVSF